MLLVRLLIEITRGLRNAVLLSQDYPSFPACVREISSDIFRVYKKTNGGSVELILNVNK